MTDENVKNGHEIKMFIAYGVRVEDQLRQSLMLQYIKDNWLKYNTFWEEFS